MSWLMPAFARLRIPRLPALWLPVFLLWPLLALCFALAFALAVPLARVLKAPPRQVLYALLQTFQMLCALRGTQISVSNPDAHFDVSFH